MITLQELAHALEAYVMPNRIGDAVSLATIFDSYIQSKFGRPQCPDCHNEIDPDTCHCGQGINEHGGETHSFVPMGCQCGREPPIPTKEEFLFRYQQRMVKRLTMPMDVKAAMRMARDSSEAVDYEDLREGFENDPEGAADEEMSNWGS
jgi:hypothetical protein